MPLQDELDAVRARCYESTPQHISRVRHDAIEDLVSSGIAERAVRAGDYAPRFRLRDANGKLISSDSLLDRGPVLLIFFRGQWCPYCSVDLRALEAVAQDIRATGTSVVAISPQTANASSGPLQLENLSFPCLVDKGARVARAFGLRWKLSQELQAAELETGLDLAVVNGEPSWTLTMPARYVIGTDGIVEYADVSADYTRRGDPTELLPVLGHIQAHAVH